MKLVKTVRTVSLLVVVAAAVAGIQASAEGQEAPGGTNAAPRWVRACAEELASRCKDTKLHPGECLAQVEDALRIGCKATFFADYRLPQICVSDIQRYCVDELKERRGLQQCFRNHQNDLSKTCRAGVARAAALKAELSRAAN